MAVQLNRRIQKVMGICHEQILVSLLNGISFQKAVGRDQQMELEGQ
jgi:hypothetical protein